MRRQKEKHLTEHYRFSLNSAHSIYKWNSGHYQCWSISHTHLHTRAHTQCECIFCCVVVARLFDWFRHCLWNLFQMRRTFNRFTFHFSAQFLCKHGLFCVNEFIDIIWHMRLCIVIVYNSWSNVQTLACRIRNFNLVACAEKTIDIFIHSWKNTELKLRPN